MATKSMNYPAAMLDFFGKKSGQSTQDFMGELKAVADDRTYFIAGLEANGYKITSQTVTPSA